MALFKIAKGNSANLETNRPTRQEGFIYLTQDDMKFHIDVGNGSAQNLRRALNASQTDALRAWYTSPADTPGTWTVTIDDLLQEDLKDGLTIRVRLSTSYNDTFNTLNVNGFGKKVVYYRQNERLTSHLPQYAEVLLTYREAHQRTFNNVTYSIPGAATSAYIYNNVDYGTSGWVLDAAYSDGNNYDRILNQYERRRAGSEITKYKLCMNDANGLLQPISIGDTTDNTKTANTVPLDPSRIIYYSQNGTTAAFGATAASVLYEDIPTSRIKYTINTDLPTFSDLYLVGTFNADGLFVLDSTFYRIVTVPSSSSSPTLANNTFTQGKYYIYVGSTHGTANEMQLHPTHGIYYCEDSNGTKLQPVTHRPVYTRSSVGTIEHDSRTNEHLITKGALAYWNGAYSGTNSNLEYTKVGKLGSMATAKKGSWVVNRVAYAAADDQLNTASLLYTTGTNLAVNKNSITSGMTFEVNGKSAFYDDMYLSCTDDTAAESKSASFYLSYDNTSTNKSTSAVIRACGGGAQATSGMLQVTSMGAVAITSGNAGGQLYSGNSDIAILSGAQIYLESNGMTEANRTGICIDSSGNVLPVKKEAANTNQQSLGSSTARWKALYIGEGDTIGSANKPIYWYDGVPTPIDITLMNGTAGKLAYYSNATTINQYTADVGSVRQIVYMNKGVPTAGNNTVAHFGNAGKTNMNEIGKLWPSTGMTGLSDPGNTVDNPMTGDTKSTSWHLYWDTSYSDDPSGSNPWVAQIVNKAGTSQWWVRSKAGSTITNGSEWSSGWRHLVTSAQAGVGSGVKPIYINTSGEATASAENIGSSLTPMYLEGGEFKAIGVSLNTSSAATKLAYYSATGTISGLTATVGSGTQPVFIDGGYPKATTYSLGATINAGTANQVAYYSGANAISSKAPAWEEWIGGTSEGPKAKIQIGNASYTSGAIPSAGSNASGVVNTTVQTFGGNKTFANNVIINGTSNFNNNTTTTGVATFNGNVVMNSSASADSLTAGSLVVSGNTSLVNTTNAGNIMPHANNTYDIGSSSMKYANIYVTELHGNATTANAFSVNKSITLTGDVTGSASSTGGWSIATTIGNGKVTNAMLVNSSMTIAGNTISLGGSLAADTLRTSLGLSSAMHFIGVATVAITDGSTTDPTISGYDFSKKQAGDVIIDANSAYEYVWSSVGKWERLGPDGSYKTVQTAITNSIGSADGTNTANTFIYSFSQDANGVVSVKTRPLSLAANGTRGGIQIGYTTSGQNYAVQLSSEKAYVNVPWTDTKVKQSASTSTKWRKVLLHYTEDNASTTAVSTVTNEVYASQKVAVSPSEGKLRATEFNIDDHVRLHYDSTTASLQFIFE